MTKAQYGATQENDMPLTLLNIANRTKVISANLRTNFTRITDMFNGNITQAECKTTAQLLNNTMHGNLGTGSNKHDADEIYLEDTGSYYSGATPETALQDIGALLDMSGGSSSANGRTVRWIGHDRDFSTTSLTATPTVSVAVPAGTTAVGIKVELTARLGTSANPSSTGTNVYIPLAYNTGSGATALSSSGTPNARWHMENNEGDASACSRTKVLYWLATDTPAWDNTNEVTLTLAASWRGGEGIATIQQEREIAVYALT